MAAPKETIFRWPLENFEDRFTAADFKQKWESDGFEVDGLTKTPLHLWFYPKSDREANRNSCALYVFVKDFDDRPFIRLEIAFWLENGTEQRLGEIEFVSKFTSTSNYWGRIKVATQTELTEFARNGPLVVCCKLRSTEPTVRVKDTTEGDILRKIAANFDAKAFADVEVHVQGRVFKVNKMIVCSGSPVFRRMFTHDTKEKRTGVVEIEKEEADVVELLLRFLYSGQVEGLPEVAARLLPLADCYEVHELVELCLEALYDRSTVDSVLRDLKLAFVHDQRGHFKQKLLKFARTNMEHLKQQPDWTVDSVRENPEIVKEIVDSCP